MAGTPDDWTDWYAAGGRALAELGPATARTRAARLQARAIELALRLPEETAEAWLALGETMGAPSGGQGGQDGQSARGHAGRA
ncbi:MAG: hypothetical protein IT556_07540 [Acetobacteraceae bacterium]|nr:hypothetical protein [Acetobacteraceae bacterium]